MPEYEGRVAFVEAITTDPRSRSVLERYPTSYIPTSIFVAAGGEVTETFVGPLNADQLRAKLDALAVDAE